MIKYIGGFLYYVKSWFRPIHIISELIVEFTSDTMDISVVCIGQWRARGGVLSQVWVTKMLAWS